MPLFNPKHEKNALSLKNGFGIPLALMKVEDENR